MSTPNEPVDNRRTPRLTVAGVVSALLSLTFLVLAAYIWWSSTIVTGRDSTELRWFAALVGAYGIWRTVRTVIRSRSGDT